MSSFKFFLYIVIYLARTKIYSIQSNKGIKEYLKRGQNKYIWMHKNLSNEYLNIFGFKRVYQTNIQVNLCDYHLKSYLLNIKKTKTKLNKNTSIILIFSFLLKSRKEKYSSLI